MKKKITLTLKQQDEW